jgi:hypothetical protein
MMQFGQLEIIALPQSERGDGVSSTALMVLNLKPTGRYPSYGGTARRDPE